MLPAAGAAGGCWATCAGADAGDGAGAGAGDGAGAGAGAFWLPFPVIPPGAPVSAIRDSASARVAQLTVVPALLTSGRAKH